MPERRGLHDCKATPPILPVPNAHVRNISQRFQDLLGQVSQESLELWSDGNRCQIDGLTALIVDSIEDSIEDLPDSIELLEILCMVYLSLVGSSFNLTNESVGGAHAPSFRDAALKRQPNLLHTLLTKASSSEPMFEKVCGLPLGTNWADWMTVCHNMHISTFSEFIAARTCYPAEALDNAAPQSSSRSDNR